MDAPKPYAAQPSTHGELKILTIHICNVFFYLMRMTMNDIELCRD